MNIKDAIEAFNRIKGFDRMLSDYIPVLAKMDFQTSKTKDGGLFWFRICILEDKVKTEYQSSPIQTEQTVDKLITIGLELFAFTDVSAMHDWEHDYVEFAYAIQKMIATLSPYSTSRIGTLIHQSKWTPFKNGDVLLFFRFCIRRTSRSKAEFSALYHFLHTEEIDNQLNEADYVKYIESALGVKISRLQASTTKSYNKFEAALIEFRKEFVINL